MRTRSRSAVRHSVLGKIPRFLCVPFLSLVMSIASEAQANSVEDTDQRFNLSMTTPEQALFLAEMRRMLGSVQGIVQGIANQDRQAIATAAQISGNRMARATPASIRAKLPAAFSQIGEPTHMMFEELAVVAMTDDMDMLAQSLGNILNQCMACHAAFKAR